MKPILALSVAAFILGSACASKTPARTGKKTEYEEDLSSYRSKYTATVKQSQNQSMETVKPKENVVPTQDLTSEINVLLDTIAERNRKINYVQGYTILVRGGQLEEAKSIRQRIMNLFPDTNPELAFDRPQYKVKVGQFYSKIEANKLYSMIKKEFPNRAILVPDVIYLYKIAQ